LKLAINANLENSLIIRELLSVWELNWLPPTDSDLIITYGREPLEINQKEIVIPSSSVDFKSWARSSKYIVNNKLGTRLSVEATSSINLSFTPKVFYDTQSSTLQVNDGLVIPELDFVEEYKRILWQTLNAKSSKAFHLATSLPLPYNVVPKQLRDLLMKNNDEHSRLNLYDVLPLDALRFALAKSIEQTLNGKLPRKTWCSKSSICILTHDVETRDGLEKSAKVKKLEEKYDLPSTWFIPSKQYFLDSKIIKDLENNGAVGSHDTKHDGRLFHLSKKDITQRLVESKRNLESITNKPINGFRAPLLQHSTNILLGLGESGFLYDASIPTWEPKHPRTMSPHGIGTVFPIHIEGINEIPLTMVQDHQLLCILDLTPKEVVSEWISNMAVIKELGGCCVYLSHPEYDLLDAKGLSYYEELLNAITSDPELLVALPTAVCEFE
jgi:peptidoglycan/xylan/chitin deacetylase (PgdA/CDA1 family)